MTIPFQLQQRVNAALAGLGQPLPEGYPPDTRVHQDLSAFADWLVTRAPAPRPA